MRDNNVLKNIGSGTMSHVYHVTGEFILDLIDNYKDDFFFTGGVSAEYVDKIKQELGVVLPDSYKWFIQHCGYGGINGVMIQGVGLDKSLQVVNVTNDLRKYDLPKSLVVIENVDEYVHCLDTERMNESECPVIDWDQGEGKGTLYYNNFYDFLYDRFSDAIENL